ncbi:MAG: hypothetical protein RIC85_04890 [Gammaproteobacteria bacterium]
MRNPPDSRDQTPEGGAPVVGPNPIYLDDPVLDTMVSIVLELAAQMWVEREQRMVLESALAARGILTNETLENFEPTDEELNKIKLARTRFVDDVFKHLERVPVVKGSIQPDSL